MSLPNNTAITLVKILGVSVNNLTVNWSVMLLYTLHGRHSVSVAHRDVSAVLQKLLKAAHVIIAGRPVKSRATKQIFTVDVSAVLKKLSDAVDVTVS